MTFLTSARATPTTMEKPLVSDGALPTTSSAAAAPSGFFARCREGCRLRRERGAANTKWLALMLFFVAMSTIAPWRTMRWGKKDGVLLSDGISAVLTAQDTRWATVASANIEVSLHDLCFKPVNTTDFTPGPGTCVDEDDLDAYVDDFGVVWHFFSSQARGGFGHGLAWLLIAFIWQSVMQRVCLASSRPVTTVVTSLITILLTLLSFFAVVYGVCFAIASVRSNHALNFLNRVQTSCEDDDDCDSGFELGGFGFWAATWTAAYFLVLVLTTLFVCIRNLRVLSKKLVFVD